MVLKAVIVSWLVFQTLQFTLWKTSFFLHSSDVIQESDDSLDGVHDDDFYASIFEEKCNTTNASALTTCENCGCSTRNLRLVLPQSTECEITDDVLREIYDLVYAAYLKAVTPPTSRQSRRLQEDEDFCRNLTNMCSTKGVSPTSRHQISNNLINNPACDQIIEDIKNITRLITDEIELLIELIMEDPSGLLIKIAQLQNCVDCLQKKIDDLVKAGNETAKCYEDGLGRVYTCFTTELGVRTERILALEQDVSKRREQLIEANVLAGKYKEAEEEYRNLSNPSIFDRLMEKLYASKRLEHILEFGYELYRRNITGRVQVYQKLTQLMNNSETEGVLRVVFRSFVNWDRFAFCGSDDFCFDQGLPFEFYPLMTHVVNKTKDSIDEWVVDVRKGTFDKLITLGSPEIVNMTGRAFHDAIDELVTLAYAKNSANLNNVANFVDALRWNNQSFTGFSALIRETASVGVGDQLHVALLMRDRVIADNLKGPDGFPENVTDQFKELKKSLRPNIRNVVWGKICTLKPVEVNSGMYLYAESSAVELPGNRRVTAKAAKDANANWSLERIEVGFNKFEFRIKSEYGGASGEYLGSHIPWRHASYDYDYVSTTKPTLKTPENLYYNWEIHFGSNVPDDQIELYHLGRQAYLHANTDGTVRLAMFGLRSGNTRWKIECTE